MLELNKSWKRFNWIFQMTLLWESTSLRLTGASHVVCAPHNRWIDPTRFCGFEITLGHLRASTNPLGSLPANPLRARRPWNYEKKCLNEWSFEETDVKSHLLASYLWRLMALKPGLAVDFKNHQNFILLFSSSDMERFHVNERVAYEFFLSYFLFALVKFAFWLNETWLKFLLQRNLPFSRKEVFFPPRRNTDNWLIKHFNWLSCFSVNV